MPMPYPGSEVFPEATHFPSTADAVVPDIPPISLVWSDPEKRYFMTGVDRGVLYSEDGVVPFDGITGATESGAGSTSVMYRDGQIYYADVEPGDYSGTLTTFFWPPEFDKCIGIPEVAPGLRLDYQRPRRFSFSYRSLIGSGTTGDMFGYQIHVFYNVLASPQSRTRKTRTNSPALDEFSFDLVAIPPRIKGYRPTAHLIIDTRGLSPEVVATLEDLLYNGDTIPDPTMLYELMRYGATLRVKDNLNGKVTVSGASSNLVKSGGKYTIKGIPYVANVDGSYTISDTP